MAGVKPFKALRPNKEAAAAVAALPYDVYDRKEAAEAVAGKPLSFLNIDRPETQYGPDFDMYSDEAYQTARDLLDKEIADGVFIQDEKPCYYIYALTMNGRTQTGITACCDVADYRNGVIKKHENTRKEKEEDRIRHVDTCNAQTGPIFLAYRRNERLAEIIGEVKEGPALYDFVSDDGIRHEVWIIDDDSTIKEIEEIFAGIGAVYIADGHHRAASAVSVGVRRGLEGESARFMSVLFADDELKILPYNRAVRDLNGLSKREYLDKVSESYEISGPSDIKEPEGKGLVCMYLDGEWYGLKSKYASDDPVAGLDVSVLQDNLLTPVLGIGDPRVDDRISFIGGIRGTAELEKLVDSGDYAVAFSMYPTQMSELLSVADAGLLMPPKSTWFEPKLRSGLFIHRL